MPHVIVKLWPGKSELQKRELAERLTRELMRVINASEKSISVGIEDVSPERWAAEVFEPDILAKPETIYKQPGYTHPSPRSGRE